MYRSVFPWHFPYVEVHFQWLSYAFQLNVVSMLIRVTGNDRVVGKTAISGALVVFPAKIMGYKQNMFALDNFPRQMNKMLNF